ncbi:MAG: hypothetical protein IT376_13960 [Polyangiaceae bacterium]|nr:hypothetical protein [Polyangiaceae bacterium]
MPRDRSRVPWAALAVAASLAVTSPAGACGERGAAPCLDAQSAWLAPGRQGASIVGAARTPPGGAATAGLALGWMSRPIVLVAPAPDPDGRELHLVDHALDLTWLLGLGIGAGVALELAAPVVLWQSGAGSDAAVSSRPAPLAPTAVRDPRIGLAAQVLGDDRSRAAATARLVVVTPLGDEEALAGERSAVVAPGAAGGWRSGAWELVGAVDARFRPRVRLADAILDDQLVAHVGSRLRLAARDALSLTLDAWAAPVLATQPRGDAVIPGEWSLGVGSRPASAVSLHLSGGTGLPLGGGGAFAPGAPRARATLVVTVHAE